MTVAAGHVLSLPILTSDEAAALVSHGDIIGFSGFTPAGAAKVVPAAIAARARAEHAAGRPFNRATARHHPCRAALNACEAPGAVDKG
jgi:acyl-CoA hydrolase